MKKFSIAKTRKGKWCALCVADGDEFEQVYPHFVAEQHAAMERDWLNILGESNVHYNNNAIMQEMIAYKHKE